MIRRGKRRNRKIISETVTVSPEKVDECFSFQLTLSQLTGPTTITNNQASSKEKSIFLTFFIFRVLPDPCCSDANTF